MKAFCIEIDDNNKALNFRPLSRRVRGTFDMLKMSEPMAKVRATEWPAIPSQRLGIDENGNGYLEEPLHEEEFSALRQKIERLGQRLEPPRQTFEGIDINTWSFWCKSAVDAGHARLVSGTFPKIDEESARKDFLTAEPKTKSQTERLTLAIERQNELFAKLIEKLA